MDAEIYLDLDTFVHRLDPRTKLFVLLTSFVLILYFYNPLWVLPLSALILFWGWLAHALSNLKRLRYIFFVMTVSSLVMWTLFSGGETPLFWIFEVEAVKYSIARTLVMLSLITAGMNLLSTTRNEELVIGMIKLGLPYRVGFAISTALRLVPTIASTTQTIAQAQRSRGLDLDGGNVIERIRKYIPLLIPVFISTIRSTNTFAMALEAKGFGAREERTFYLEPQFRRQDYMVMAVLAVLFVVTTYFKFAGYGMIDGLIRF
ncbi:MAG: energy-coupling factor transporter transmembrane component T [Chloroflexota bacterium]|nr:energy-coupling factor transporter transmembrane component T [Chloroflexota bacterium]